MTRDKTAAKRDAKNDATRDWQRRPLAASVRTAARTIARTIVLAIAVATGFAAVTVPAHAQEQGRDAWSAGVEILKSVTPGAGNRNTTVIGRKRAAGEGGGATSELRLMALLTSDGQQIDNGIVWRIFSTNPATRKLTLVGEYRDATPAINLAAGDYTVNAAFGRAHYTRRVTVKPGQNLTEQFVLNAGGLRVRALYKGASAPAGMVTYAIYVDEREQFTSPTVVMSSVKPDLIIRLNAGIYRIISRFGDANARVEADVTVEAGKLSETTVTHAAGRAAFKLVTRPGGEALPDTVWTIKHTDGTIVKESVGALPSHYLKPGHYIVTAKSAGQIFSKDFEVSDGENTTVEVLRGDPNQPPPAVGANASTPLVSPANTTVIPGFSLDDDTLVPSLNLKNN